MTHQTWRGSATSQPKASLAAKSLKRLGWPWPAHAQKRLDFLNQGCEYLDLELGETHDSWEFTFHSESPAVYFDGARLGEVHL